MSETLYTVGHSNQSLDDFVDALRAHEITAVADVRSHPYARYSTHFDQTPLSRELKSRGIEYVFLGDELGARRTEADCYVNGRVDFRLVQKSPKFRSGLDRVRRGMERFRLAMMCAERDPLTCHRTLLIARTLREEIPIVHIISADTKETLAEAEQRLIAHAKLPKRHLFMDEEELIADAYAKLSGEIAFEASSPLWGDG